MLSLAHRLKELDSKSSLIEDIRRATSRPILIGETTQNPQKFYIINLPDLNIFIGMITQFHGISPSVLLCRKRAKLILGYDAEVVIISTSDGVIVNQIPLHGVFYKFLRHGEFLVAVHELGIIVFTLEGKVIKSVDTCIVLNATIEANGLLRLETEEGIKELTINDKN